MQVYTANFISHPFACLRVGTSDTMCSNRQHKRGCTHSTSRPFYICLPPGSPWSWILLRFCNLQLRFSLSSFHALLPPVFYAVFLPTFPLDLFFSIYFSLLFSFLILSGWCNGDALVLYYESTRFESRQDYQLSCIRVFVVTLSVSRPRPV
jgi:hypothetical protein